MSLQQKADDFQKIIEERHEKYGYFSDIELPIPGNTSEVVFGPGDADS